MATHRQRRQPSRAKIVAPLAALIASLFSVAAAAPAGASTAGDLVISEIMQNPSAVFDEFGEWIEVHNTTGAAIDLSGWTLSDQDIDSHTVASSVVVPAGGYAVLCANDDATTNGGVTCDYDYDYNEFQLANGSDEVVITDSDGDAIDTVVYDNGATFPDPTGASTSLDPDRLDAADNDDGSNWCEATSTFGSGDSGTPGAANDECAGVDGGGGGGACGAPTHVISQVQGSAATSPLDGSTVTIQGIVVGDFQDNQAGESGDLRGYFVQEEDADADADPDTSEGIFIFDETSTVSVGDEVSVTGTVGDFQNQTQLSSVNATVCSTGNTLPTPATPTVPTSLADPNLDYEAIEAMRVTFNQTLTVTGQFNHGRFGVVQLSAIGAQDHPNQSNLPGSAGSNLTRALNQASRVILNDGFPDTSAFQNPDPTPYLGGPNATLRSGATVAGLTGVVRQFADTYDVHPTAAPSFSHVNRPGLPAVGGSLTVASFNVLNYFTTFGSRGADDAAEFTRQADKIVAALDALDADVVGIIEVENNGTAIDDLVTKLNAVSTRTYDAVDTGVVGSDAIAVGFIYDTATVQLVGNHQVLDSSVSPAYLDDKNRPAVAQTFEEVASGGQFTAVVNHLKSKGSDCDATSNPGDPAYGVAAYTTDPEVPSDFQGNCNLTRTAAATVLGQWAEDIDTSGNVLIMGDLNAYASEDPIEELANQGYADLVADQLGTSFSTEANTYVFDGEHGSLDYLMANANLNGQVAGVGVWQINSEEPRALDYQDWNPAANYSADEWKSSDHDPVIVGLDLAAAATYQCGPIDGDAAAFAAAGYTLTVGTAADDVLDLRGESTPQAVIGLDGNDRVYGSSAGDLICLGNGDDRAWGFAGDDTVYGDAGNDVISTHGGNDTVHGGAGTDVVTAATGADTLNGGDGDDRLRAGADDDVVNGDGGADRLWGEDGNDTLDGGIGDDLLLSGGNGDDQLRGGDGRDVMWGGDGNDTLDAQAPGATPSVLNGHGGTDTCIGAATDRYTSCEL